MKNTDKWVSLRKVKPPRDTPVLVFRHGFDITGTRYWEHIGIAEYVKPPYKKRLVFATNIQREKDGTVYAGYPLGGVSHWMLLPNSPRVKKCKT